MIHCVSVKIDRLLVLFKLENLYIQLPIFQLKHKIVHISILLSLPWCTKGQTTSRSIITYISKVPIVVETGIYETRLYNNRSFISLTGNIRIALAPRKIAVTSDQYFNLEKPLSIQEYSSIEYNYTNIKFRNKHWFPLTIKEKEKEIFPYNGLLADLQLQHADSVILSFRKISSHKPIQQFVFTRPEIFPVIEGVRQKNDYDSVDSKLKALTANDPKKIWAGFDTVKTTKLTVSPGKKLELLIRRGGLNSDSCIMYRIYQNPVVTNPNWQVTGHLLSLNSLEANSKYILEIRYQDMSVSNTYAIETKPYWYQSKIGKYTLLILAMVIFTSGPYSIYRYRLRKETRKRKRLEEQLTTVQTQLNPHFVFNALSSIEGLVTNNENVRANEYLTSFSDIMRDTLRNSREHMIPLSHDLDTLEKYLRVEQLRFEFKWRMEIDPELDLDQIEFPPMLLQPVVENAIKHGIAGQGKDGEMIISFTKRDNHLLITVTDNGGLQKKVDKKGNGYGLQLTHDRIERLRELYKTENIHFKLTHFSESSVATYYFENWIHAYENDYH